MVGEKADEWVCFSLTHLRRRRRWGLNENFHRVFNLPAGYRFYEPVRKQRGARITVKFN